MTNSPLTIVSIMWRAMRPSRTTDMPALALPFWIRKGYDGMTFFGRIITHNQAAAEHFNTHFDALKNHEMIHLYQARSTHDSWLCFYGLYLCYWLLACRYCFRLRNAGYLLNPFEMEAYAHMNDLSYLSDKTEGAAGWRQYASMSLKERLQLMKNQ